MDVSTDSGEESEQVMTPVSPNKPSSLFFPETWGHQTMRRDEGGYAVPPNTPANGKVVARSLDFSFGWPIEAEAEAAAPPNTPVSATHAGFSESMGLFWFNELDEMFEDALTRMENKIKLGS